MSANLPKIGSKVADGNSVTTYRRYTRASWNTYGNACYPLLPATEKVEKGCGKAAKPKQRARERVLLILAPMDDAVPFAIRLRGVLKDAKRRHRMECLDYRELPQSAPPDAPHEHTNPLGVAETGSVRFQQGLKP